MHSLWTLLSAANCNFQRKKSWLCESYCFCGSTVTAEVSVVTGPLLRVWLWASPPLPGARLQLGEFALKDVKLPSMVQVETVECLIPVSY